VYDLKKLNYAELELIERLERLLSQSVLRHEPIWRRHLFEAYQLDGDVIPPFRIEFVDLQHD
jgi:hypothetical protein